MKALGILFGISFFALDLAAAEFSKGDQIRLIQDTPLYFKESTVLRVGKRGERFTVLAARPQEHRVYVSTRDARGQEIALNIADDSVALVEATAPGLPPPGPIPGVLASRFGVEARAKAMDLRGGQPASEDAVLLGLRYLVKTQNGDGSWGKGTKPYVAAMTGFSLLSLLGHGETPDSPEFGLTIKMAIRWIMEHGQASQARLSMEPSFSASGVYAHAIVTFALAEYYTMTRDAAVVDVLTRAVSYIVAGQGPDGGWMYAYDKSESDTSVSGWQMQALKAAHLSGLNLDGVDNTLDKAVLNLRRVQGPKGGFGYRRKEDRYSLTGVGVYCAYSWEQEKNRVVREGIEFMLEQAATRYPVKYEHESANLYAWYYNTLACATVGGRAWQTWNVLFQEQIAKHQSPDGSWPPLAKVGGGELQSDPEGIGPLYRTNLCILMLEVYYRYMSPPSAP